MDGGMEIEMGCDCVFSFADSGAVADATPPPRRIDET